MASPPSPTKVLAYFIFGLVTRQLLLRSSRWIPVGLASLAIAVESVALGAPSPGKIVPPAFISHTLAGPKLAGEGEMRFLGFQIYDARLWVGPLFNANAFVHYPFVLELIYRRAFTATAIVQRSMEEIERQRKMTVAQAKRWRDELATLMPDVQSGDQLAGVYEPAKGMSLWRNGKELGSIEDIQLAHAFFGIWLSPQTSEPELRKALLEKASP